MIRLSFSAVLLLGIVFLSGCSTEEMTTTNVRIQEAIQAGIPHDVQLSGTLTPKRETDIAARISGRAVSIVVDKGDRVQKGDTLVRLDPAVEAAVLGGLGSTIRQARSNLDTVIALYDERIKSAESTLAQLRTTAATVVNTATVQEETGGNAEDRQAREVLTNTAIALESSADSIDRLFLFSPKYTDITQRDRIRQHIGARDPSMLDTVASSYGALRAEADAFRTFHDTNILGMNPQTATIEKGLAQAETALSLATRTLENVHTVLQLSVTSNDYTQADLSAQEQIMIGHASQAESLARSVRSLANRDTSKQHTAVREQTQAQTAMEVEQASRALDVLRREKDAKIAEVQATITRLQAEAGISAAQLDQTVIRAPFDGVIVSRTIDPGAVVGPGTPLLTIADDTSFELALSVPDSALASLTVGREASISIDTLPDATFPGSILRIAPSADADSKKIQVDLSVDNSDGTLKSGMFARAEFPLASGTGIVIPSNAVLARYGRDIVFVLEEGLAVQRFVTIEARSDTVVAIASGIEEGESVLMQGHHYLRDGDPVTVITPKEDTEELSISTLQQ